MFQSPTRTSHRTSIFRKAGAFAVLAVLSVGASACQNANTPQLTASNGPATAAAAVSPSGASPPAGVGHTYRETTDACSVLDRKRLVDAFGEDSGNLVKPQTQDSQLAAFARCDRRFGSPTARSVVSIQIMVVKRDTAQSYYEGTRSAQQKSDELTDVPGLGQHAYTYSDPQTGPHIVMYDGNLYLSIAILGGHSRTNDPVRLNPVLVGAARHAADQLRKL